VSLPLGLAAVLARVPLVIHEQNAVPGIANKVLARWASTVCLTYAESERHLRGRARSVVTGNPVRASVLAADRSSGRKSFGIAEDETALLAFGGSRGARHLNAALVNLYVRLRDVSGLRVIHVAGPSEAATVRESLAVVSGGSVPAWWTVREYVDGMGDLIAASDLVVCRAGATTLAELSVLAKAMILVPYPYATDDHQTHNAHPFVEAKGAVSVEDSSLDEAGFGDTLLRLLRDPDERSRMAANAGTLGRPLAAESVVKAVLEAGASRFPRCADGLDPDAGRTSGS
jgi:UDP-N-acetylglucosamine--N-acetylmuramyl-(pentapeptide) pyrophosphoryl-undecaprenol N-acetylglucosamine transferase